MTSSDHSATPYDTLAPLLEAYPDPTIVIALEQERIVAANTLATTFLDRSPSTLQQTNPKDLRDPQDRIAFAQALEQLTRLAVPPAIALEESLLCARNTSPVLSHLRSFSFHGTRHALHVFRPLATDSMDLEDLHRLEAELHEAKKAAQRDARRNGAFYASLSRELRNPLTSILGYLDLIADPESPERDRSAWLTQIRKSGESLMNLVQDLVDLGQMEAGTFHLEPEAFSTSLALAHVISQARARSQQRDRDVIARYTTPVPRTLTLDPVRFRQCLSTLMHFVIENTSRGDITLQAAVIGNGDERRLAFDVSSHSRDLVQADLDPLFDPFQPTTPRARPWSLAFPVARRIAQMMGGTIECGLDPDRVWFRLTIQPAAGDFSRMAHLSLPDEEERPPSTHPPMRLRGTVLLVEDNEADRLLVTKMLERSGLRVDFVTGGEEVLERPVHRYDAILMDLELPDMNGLEATRRLRADGATVPIVALTASVLPGDRERCLDAGCTAYVAKPIDRPMLLRTLDGLISTTEDRRVLSVLPPGLASVEPLSSTREDDPSLLQILPQFVTRMSRFVDHIARATRDRELATATKTARSLGATADNCGFPPLADAANAVAQACSRPKTDDEEIKHCVENLEQVTRRIQAAYPQSIPPSG